MMSQTDPSGPRVLRRRDVRDHARMRVRAELARHGIDPADRPARPVRVSLWLPTTALFALLAPFALILLPFLYLAPRRILPDPAGVLVGVGRLLLSLSGTHVEVDTPDAHVRLRLF
ncbi:MAG TPA: hypothetical protein VFH92_09115 [Phenylobacterium sp.]|nr:hypothetical protein [Phenylobacterium sp.]